MRITLKMCLLLGSTGVGKTLFMKRLENISSASKNGNVYKFEDMPSTIQTVGTNLVNVSLRRHELVVREIGGCMGPIWKSYLSDATALIYMIDVSNRLQVAASCMQLLTVLTSSSLKPVPVLILLNKIDLPELMTDSEVESLFRLEDIKTSYGSPISHLNISACTGQGIGEVIKWLEQLSEIK